MRKFYYDLQGKPLKEFAGLYTYRSSERARFLHPMAMLSFGNRSLPSDLALEAADTLSVYKALESSGFPTDDLNPVNFFPRDVLLRQEDILRYESKLKTAMTSLIATCDPRDPSSRLHGVIRSLGDPVLFALPDANPNPSRDTFRKNLIYLIADLEVQGRLVSDHTFFPYLL